MGLQCTKASRVPIIQKTRNVQDPTLSPLSLSLISPYSPNLPKSSIVLKIYKRRITNSGALIVQLLQTKKITPETGSNSNYSIGNFKYVYDKGLEDMLFGEKLDENSMGFVVQKSLNGNLFVQLKTREADLIWKKVDNQGIQLVQKDEVLVGKYHLKLLFWLEYKEGSKLKHKSSVRVGRPNEQGLQCRICLQQGYAGNPLIRPCKCTGSVSAIHQRCLSKWIFNNPVSFQQRMSYYKVNIRHNQCQICKSSFKDYIWNRIMTIVSTFDGYYAIFELKNEKQKSPIQLVQQFVIFKFDQNHNCVKIGDSEAYNYFIPSIIRDSVSTNLIMQNSRLYLKDNNSKIGPYIRTTKRSLNFETQYKIGLHYLQLLRV